MDPGPGGLAPSQGALCPGSVFRWRDDVFCGNNPGASKSLNDSPASFVVSSLERIQDIPPANGKTYGEEQLHSALRGYVRILIIPITSGL